METTTKSLQNFAELRIVYLASDVRLAEIRSELETAGAILDANSIADEPRYLVRSSFIKRVFKQTQFTDKYIRMGAVYLFDDIFRLVKALPKIDCDLLIIDERTPSALENINFESLVSAIRQFTPRDFGFSMRRVVVVLPQNEKTSGRIFKLGLNNVRKVVVDPENSVELFKIVLQELEEFRRNRTKTVLSVAGGGLEGYIYELGVLAALDACFTGRSVGDFDMYSGVSSGSIAAACLAAGISTNDLLRQLHRLEGKLEPLSLGVIFDFATSEIVGRVASFLKGISVFDVPMMIGRLRQLVPLGIFKGEKLRSFIERSLARVGVPDDISRLSKQLFISATDLDTGEHVIFGEGAWSQVKISQAVRASTALPPFYLPERINGHWFTDGQIKSSYNFNRAIDKGAGLVLLIDPMVAYSTHQSGVVKARGGYFVAVQAIKGLVESRSVGMLEHAMDMNPDVDFVVFKPTDEVMEAMTGNPMRYHIRTELAELGYRGTLIQVLDRYEALSHRLGKYGFFLRPPAEIKTLLNRTGMGKL